MLKISRTLDGSDTLTDEIRQETYHSVNGAVQESMHIFIQQGLRSILPDKKAISIFEMGFGTGLNTLLTVTHMPEDTSIQYFSLEAFPVPSATLEQLNYSGLSKDAMLYSHIIHQPFNTWKQIRPGFLLRKEENDFLHAEIPPHFFDLIYYDAFGPPTQPELWTLECMQKCYAMLRQGGILVTYCAQGQFRRNLKDAGFKVDRLPGPPGKREMTRAVKI